MLNLKEFNRLKACRHGRMLYNVNDAYIGRSLELYGEFSEGEVQLFDHFVRPGDVVIDVGANNGAHTLWFAKSVGPTGLVIAFEPQRLLFQTLCANIALNSLQNVMSIQRAVGEAAGVLLVPMLDPHHGQNFGALELGGIDEGEQVPVARLDDLGLGQCRLIKVDVEGMELAVLKGAKRLIEQTRPILYVENDRPERGRELTSYLTSIGYEMYWHLPPLFNPQNYFGNEENVFGQTISINMLCAPAGTRIDGLERVELPPE